MAKKKQTKAEIIGITPEPVDLTKRRGSLLKRLQAEAAKRTGAVQQVLRKMHQLVASTEPEAPYQEKLFGDVAESFSRLLKSAQGSKAPVEIPEIVAESNQFVMDHAASLRERMEKVGLEVPPEKKIAAEKAAAISQGIKDEMSKAPHRNSGEILGNVDAPLKGQPTQPEKKIPEDLKKWVNPGLGRIGNK